MACKLFILCIIMTLVLGCAPFPIPLDLAETGANIMDSAGNLAKRSSDVYEQSSAWVVDSAGTIRDSAGNLAKRSSDVYEQSSAWVVDSAGTIRDSAGNLAKRSSDAFEQSSAWVVGTSKDAWNVMKNPGSLFG